MAASQADILRRKVEAASDEGARLDALLTLARHYVDVGDGVNGYAAAREARSLALQLGDPAAAAHALNSVSMSQYHRSEFVSAITTALDAWDYANRGGSERDLADSYYSIAFSLYALGGLDAAEKMVAKGFASVSGEPELLESRVRLTRLRGILYQARGAMDDAERTFVEAMKIAEGVGRMQLATCYAYWAIGWLRRMDARLGGGPIIPEKLREARGYLEKALAVAEEDGDVFLVSDRLSLLGGLARIEQRWDDAEKLLTDALERARALDYVRAIVTAAVGLGRTYLERDELQRAVEVLRHAVEQARRGAADDILGVAQSLLVTTLERAGSQAEAAKERERGATLRHEATESRMRALEQATRLVSRIVG